MTVSSSDSLQYDRGLQICARGGVHPGQATSSSRGGLIETNNRHVHNKQIPNREALAGNRNQDHITVRQQHKQGEIE